MPSSYAKQRAAAIKTTIPTFRIRRGFNIV